MCSVLLCFQHVTLLCFSKGCDIRVFGFVLHSLFLLDSYSPWAAPYPARQRQDGEFEMPSTVLRSRSLHMRITASSGYVEQSMYLCGQGAAESGHGGHQKPIPKMNCERDLVNYKAEGDESTIRNCWKILISLNSETSRCCLL